MDLCTHFVSHHFIRGSSCVCSQHHPILQQHRQIGTLVTKFNTQIIIQLALFSLGSDNDISVSPVELLNYQQ